VLLRLTILDCSSCQYRYNGKDDVKRMDMCAAIAVTELAVDHISCVSM